jgi:hypothetical protein
MTGLWKVPIWLLLLAVMLTSAAVHPILAGITHDKPAGCHSHGRKMPSPQPRDANCCVSGHDSALTQSGWATHDALQAHSDWILFEFVETPFDGLPHLKNTFPTAPPGTESLRI